MSHDWGRFHSLHSDAFCREEVSAITFLIFLIRL